MSVAGCVGAAGLGLALAASVAASGTLAAEAGLSAYQGAWLASGPDCAEVYSSAGKGMSFKKPVDIFAPAFIISGNRLRTPQASCRIKSVKPTGDRQSVSEPRTRSTGVAAATMAGIIATAAGAAALSPRG
jgi:hypothetical protein